MTTPAIAVIDAQRAYLLREGKVYSGAHPEPVSTLVDLVGLAHRLQIFNLWILPGSALSYQAGEAPGAFIEPGRGLDTRASTTMRGVPRYMQAWRTEGTYQNRATVRIAFPEHDKRWGRSLQKIGDPRTMLHAVGNLQDALDFPVEWSPGHSGQALMEHLNDGKREAWIQPASLPPEITKGHMASDLKQKVPIDADLADGHHWLHVYDKLSHYLGACTSAILGEGNPMHIREINGPSDRFTSSPGLWRYEFVDQADNPGLKRDRAGQLWAWTPEVAYAWMHPAQYKIKLLEAYIWPKYHQTLRSWAEKVWGARCDLASKRDEHLEGSGMHQALEASYQAIKEIYTNAMGWLAHPPKGGSMQFYRPDWWSTIISTARVKMLYKIEQLATSGYIPHWVNTDALGFISDVENPLEAVQGILDRQGCLGAFRHAFSVPVDVEVIRLFSEQVNFSECRLRLLELAGKRR